MAFGFSFGAALGAGCIAAALAWVAPAAAQPAGAHDLGCVFPKVRPLPNRNIAFARPVFVYPRPRADARPRVLLKRLYAFNFIAERSGFLEITGTPSSAPNFPEDQVAGWVKSDDMDWQALRNCYIPK